MTPRFVHSKTEHRSHLFPLYLVPTYNLFLYDGSEKKYLEVWMADYGRDEAVIGWFAMVIGAEMKMSSFWYTTNSTINQPYYARIEV